MRANTVTWQCPKCGAKQAQPVRTLAVGHFCPAARNQAVDFKRSKS